MKKIAALALLSVWLAAPVSATDMGDCSTVSGRAYSLLPDEECYLLCDGVGTTTGTLCGPLQLPKELKDVTQFSVGIGSAAAGCTTGNIAVSWCATATCAAPAVPQTFATLTGATSVDTSSFVFPYSFGRTYQATYSIADTDCNANGGVDVFIKVRRKK